MISLTFYRHALQPHRGLRMVMDRDELVHALADAGPHDGEKSAIPLACFTTFRGNHRRNANVESVHVLGLDLDEPTADPSATIARARAALGGVEVFAYSTFSSKPGAFKLRALVPYDRGATGDEHRASWVMVARVLGRAGVNVDPACSDPARGFYLWSVPPCGAYFHAHLDGAPWPVALAAEVEAERIAGAERLRAEAAAHRAARAPASSVDSITRARRYVAKMPAAISGSGGHAATFAVARRLVADFELPDADAWDLLLEFNERCEPRWSDRELRHKLASAQKARVRVDMVGQ